MADFNANLPPTNPIQDQTGASKEPNRFLLANHSLETLFTGIGDAVGNTAKAAYQGITENVKNDIYNGVDPIRDSQGVALAAANAEISGKPLNLDKLDMSKPPNGDQVTGSVARMTDAWNHGALKDTDYYTRLEALTRQIRARYPGFREEIDSMIQNVTGVNPANALRKAIQSDLSSAQSDADAQKKADAAFRVTHAADLPPDQFAREQQGNPYSMFELHDYYAKRVSEQSEISAARAKIGLQQDQGNLNVTQATSSAQKELDIGWNKMINDTTLAMGGVDGLQKKILSLVASGKTISDEDTKNLMSAFTQIEAKWRNHVDTTLSTPIGSSGSSYDSILGPSAIGQMRNGALQKVADLKQMLTDKDFGGLYLNLSTTNAMQNSDARNVLSQFPVIRSISAISSLQGGKEFLQSVLASGGNKILPSGLKEVEQAVSLNARANPSNAADNVRTLADQEKTMGKGAVKSYLESWQNDMTGVTTPPEVFNTRAKEMFGPNNKDFLKYFDKDDQVGLFTRLTDPRITDRVFASGDKDLIKTYGDWAKNSMFNVFRSSVDEVKNFTNGKYIDINYDPKSNQFAITPTQSARDEAKSRGLQGGSMDRWLQRTAGIGNQVYDAVNKLNMSLSTTGAILKKEGLDPSKEIGALMDINAVKAKGSDENSVWGKVFGGWSKTFQPYEGPEVHTGRFAGSDVNFSKPSGDKLEGSISLKDVQQAISQPSGLKDLISKAEGTSHSEGYNTILGGGRLPLTNMTMNQVLSLQQHMVKNLGMESGAVGKYQIVEGTLRGLMTQMGIKGDDIFTPELQERLADKLIENRRSQATVNGKLDPVAFHRGLAQEWAGLPTPEGGSYYEGDGINHSSMNPKVLSDAIGRTSKEADMPARGAKPMAGEMKPNTEDGFYVPPGKREPFFDPTSRPNEDLEEFRNQKLSPWHNNVDVDKNGNEVNENMVSTFLNPYSSNSDDKKVKADDVYRIVRDWGTAYNPADPHGAYFTNRDIKRYPELKEIIKNAPEDIEVYKLKDGYHLRSRPGIS